MKKVVRLLSIVVIALIWGFSVNVYAASGLLGISSENVHVGDSFTVTAYVVSAASWDVHVTASGPVSGCSVNEANATEDAKNANKSFSATCKATGTGTITISLTGNVTDEASDFANYISGTKTVTVTEKPAPTPTPKPTPTPTPTPSNNDNNKKEEPKSNNNKLKEITVEGFELEKVDDNNYTLNVANDVEKINIKAVLDDTKASVTGTGEKEIAVGDNNIEIVVTAEDGSQNKINIKVTRKEETEENVEPVIDDPVDDVEEPEVKENGFNIIPIIMIGLNIILVIAVVVLYKKNKKLKENNN